jgi:hypothetical protein
MDENRIADTTVDLSEGTIDIAQERSNESWSQTFRSFKQRESRWTLNFKIFSFIAVLALAIIFLITGLCITSQSVLHISMLQEKQLDLIEKNFSSEIENLQVKKSTIIAGPITDSISKPESKPTGIQMISSANAEELEKSLPPSQQVNREASDEKNSPPRSESNADKTLTITIATGSIITLIAFILGVGLTLLLTLLKFTFYTEDPTKDNSNNITYAGPLSELITQLVSYIKSKIK